jgi:hypothetical protein
MLQPFECKVAVDLVRRTARAMRHPESASALRMMNACLRAQWGGVTGNFLLPFGSQLQEVLKARRFDQRMLPGAIEALLEKNRLCAARNLQQLEAFGERIRSEAGLRTDQALLAGEAAALIALYRDPGAFLVGEWMALLTDGTCLNGTRPKHFQPPPLNWASPVEFGGQTWLIPAPALLVAMLAVHVGDPANSPDPPVWLHLGLAILVWKETVSARAVAELGEVLGHGDQVDRGLAIIAHLFPELLDWVGAESGRIPNWEKKLAIPLAARRIVMGVRE